MAVFKASYSKGPSSGSVKYALHRKQELDELKRDYAPRTAFTAYETGLDTSKSLEQLSQHEQDGKGYTYRFVLNAGEGRDAPVDYQQWTRDTMQELESRLERPIPYVAVVHDDHTQHTHVHVIAHLDKTLRKDDLNYIRQATTELYAEQKQRYQELVNESPELPFEIRQQQQTETQIRPVSDEKNNEAGENGKSKAGGREAENESQEKPKRQRQRGMGWGE